MAKDIATLIVENSRSFGILLRIELVVPSPQYLAQRIPNIWHMRRILGR